MSNGASWATGSYIFQKPSWNIMYYLLISLCQEDLLNGYLIYKWKLCHNFNPGSLEIRASKYISATPFIMYLTARFATVSKWNVQWVALKRRFNMRHMFYVYIGTYCCVCTMLLQVRIELVHNSNIQWVSLKVNVLLCWKYPLNQTQPQTYPIVLQVQKWYKNTFVDAAMLF